MKTGNKSVAKDLYGKIIGDGGICPRFLKREKCLKLFGAYCRLVASALYDLYIFTI